MGWKLANLHAEPPKARVVPEARNRGAWRNAKDSATDEQGVVLSAAKDLAG